MTILPNAPWCAMVTLNGLNQGTRWQNKLHFSYTVNASLTVTNLQALNAGVVNAWTAQIAPLCNTNVTLTSISSMDLNSRTGPVLVQVETTPPAGTRTGTAMPVQTALTTSWAIQNRYRGGHARTYWPGGVLGDVVSGHTWSSTFQGLAATNSGLFLTACNAISSGAVNFTFVMLSYFSGSHKLPGQPPPPPQLRPVPVPFAITAAVVHPRIDTQRRRLGKEIP